MKREQLEVFKQWFTEYVRPFYTTDDEFLNQNIQLKECHTHRVCNEMRQLAAALKMNETDTLLAETIALFHDVGRFPQFKQYRTYKDTISENHCLLALKVLGEHRMLANLDDGERAVVEKAVELHGEKELPKLDDRTSHFAKMIRDADKIDIFELLVKNYRILAEEPEKFKWEVEFPDTPECNREIIDAVLNNQRIGYEKLKTVNDAKLLQLGWVFDVYFDYSLKQIYDRGYLQAIINLLPKTEDVKKVTGHILTYTHERIGRPELMSDKRYNDKIEKLRNPERIARYEMDRMMQTCLNGIETKSVLDVGTGSGLFAEAFFKKGLVVAGADVNPEMIAAAKDFVPTGRFEIAPAEKMPFKDWSFDLVFMANVFHEVDDHVQTLLEAKRIAVKRIAILEYPHKEQPFGPPMHHRLKPEQIRDFAKQAGLETLKIVELTNVNLYLMDISS